VLRHKSVNSSSHVISLPPLRRQRRAVLVRVITWGHEVDAFEVSAPQTLRAALRPIYSHLPAQGTTVEFRAVEEDWLPLGIDRARHEAKLRGLDDALGFLAA